MKVVFLLILLLASFSGCRSDTQAAALQQFSAAFERSEAAITAMETHCPSTQDTLKALGKIRQKHSDAIHRFQKEQTALKTGLSKEDEAYLFEKREALLKRLHDAINRCPKEANPELLRAIQTI